MDRKGKRARKSCPLCSRRTNEESSLMFSLCYQKEKTDSILSRKSEFSQSVSALFTKQHSIILNACHSKR